MSSILSTTSSYASSSIYNTRIILCRHGTGSSYFSSKIRDSSHVDQINVRPVTGVPVSHIYDITQKMPYPQLITSFNSSHQHTTTHGRYDSIPHATLLVTYSKRLYLYLHSILLALLVVQKLFPVHIKEGE